MTPIERAEQLKAAFRAKAAAKAAEEERIKAKQEAESEANFLATVARALKERDCEWLAGYGRLDVKADGDRMMVYQLPGHQPICVVFCSMGGTEWADASVARRSTWPWYVGSPELNNWNGYHAIAEALCKAEEPAESPIPL